MAMQIEKEIEQLRSELRAQRELMHEQDRMLRRLVRYGRIAMIYRSIWFAVVIAVPLAIYMWAQPIYDTVASEYVKVRTELKSASDAARMINNFPYR